MDYAILGVLLLQLLGQVGFMAYWWKMSNKRGW